MALSSAPGGAFGSAVRSSVVDPPVLLPRPPNAFQARYPRRIVTPPEDPKRHGALATGTSLAAGAGRTAVRVRQANGSGQPARPTAPRRVSPILVRQMRGGVEESVHRGDVVQA